MMNLLSVDWMRARKAWFFWVMLIIAAAVSMLVFQENYSMIIFHHTQIININILKN